MFNCFYKIIKYFWYKQQYKVNIDPNLMNQLFDRGFSITELEEEINCCLHKLDYEFDKEYKNSQETKGDRGKLVRNFKYLDKILYCSIGQKISIGINESMVGKEYKYILKYYEINAIENSVYLKLERKDDLYNLYLGKINSIEWNEDRIWIYMSDKNWKLYHFIDNEKITKLGENFRSQYIELEEDRNIYMQYKNNDKLMYYVERFKYNYRDTDFLTNEKEVTDKRENKIILVNRFNANSEYKRTGTIYAFSEYGDEGKFHYELQRECLYIIDMLPIRHSIGIGSHALKFFEEIAGENGINKIKGMLSSVDFDHKERLLHFYKKNGYKIDAAETKIEKILV